MDKFLTVNNLKFVIQLSVLLVGLVLAYSSLQTEIYLIKKDIEVIQGNHLTHIQEDINEIKADMKILKEALTNILIQIK